MAARTTLLRPQVVSDYQAARVSKERFKWRAFTVLTWAVTLGAGFFMSMQDHPGVPGTGDHALKSWQRFVRRTWEDVVLGAGGGGAGGGAGAAASNVPAQAAPPAATPAAAAPPKLA